ncbi:ribbon-helix-helix domain-containing protein [uncultured Thiohalocapsa sp.]|uniref:ribbon-helix-helix domain-containing protein n=1 Tax=uncultured Thiohalocapsa sp. TaxID=768990 RepID=UPI0025ECA4F0|nr:ribbon-helix-helix domain-containing protein [uncultured Thiohalocapsa sp.]
MHRTTVMLPEALKRAAQAHASRRGISLGELLRESLEQRLKDQPPDRSRDPLFLDRAIHADAGPTDTAEHHDDYLYDDSSA